MFWLLLLAAFLFSAWAQVQVRSTFARWSRVPARSGLTGAAAAREVLRAAGVPGVRVERVQGFLADHYDPRKRVLRLSPKVHDGRDVAALGVAAHEAGHAIQHARRYAPLELRNLAVPTAGLGSSLGFPLIFLGILLHWTGLALAGLVLFAAVVLFQLVTLPVELDASRRAIRVLEETGMVGDPEERRGVRRVLSAAALTYLAAALVGVLYLLHFAGLVLGGRD